MTTISARTDGLVGRWIGPHHERTATADAERTLQRALGLEPLAARLFVARGHGETSDAKAAIAPSLKAMHDPMLLPGCDLAAQRLLQAIDVGEPIAIYGDYDVDGITATAILFHLIKAIDADADVRTYVPHRLDEGYGLNEAAIAELADAGAKVIVSVDCGITAVGPARVAQDKRVDLIITDHHNMPGESGEAGEAARETGGATSSPPAEFPPAFALVHPRLLGPDGRPAYPFGELCGAGVAFKLAWRMAVLANGGEPKVSADMRNLLLDLMALAGLGTIADVVPMRDENRLLARFGLQRLKTSSLTGLRALLDASGLLGERVSAEDAGFKIGPRLNACGRMGHAADAVELMTVANEARAAEIAASLDQLNKARQSTQRSILDQACELAEQRGMIGDGRRAIVLNHADWHPGVVGIVCSRLVERFGRPAILTQPDADGACKGSGRSVEGYNLHGALAACADHLLTFGGHDMAAGLRVKPGAFDDFAEALCQHADAAIDDDMMRPALRYDAEAELHEITCNAIAQIDSLGPFGRSNPEPLVMLPGVRVQRCEPMGTAGKHLQLRVTAPSDSPGFAAALRLVGWGMGDCTDSLRPGESADVVCSLRVNSWNGTTNAEGVLKDMRRAGHGLT